MKGLRLEKRESKFKAFVAELIYYDETTHKEYRTNLVISEPELENNADRIPDIFLSRLNHAFHSLEKEMKE